uniref:Uncharacterized protein n=1 Tax=Setaria italica TaxID=4555 RepID=K3XU36_SETIT
MQSKRTTDDCFTIPLQLIPHTGVFEDNMGLSLLSEKTEGNLSERVHKKYITLVTNHD